MKKITFIEFQECGSTNDEIWNFLKPDNSPVLISTQTQTKGRGRQGRAWQSLSGNILVSLGFQVNSNLLSKLGWVPLCAGIAAMEALEKALIITNKAIQHDLRLKWPNDIYFNDKKLGGILCESRVRGEQAQGMVVGLGLNLIHKPELSELKAGTISADVIPESSAKVLSALRLLFIHYWAETLIKKVEQLEQGATEDIRLDWEKWAKLDRFSELTVHDSSQKKIQVHALNLESSGKLKVRTLPGEQFFLDQADSI